jgi:hypothetical protein
MLVFVYGLKVELVIMTILSIYGSKRTKERFFSFVATVCVIVGKCYCDFVKQHLCLQYACVYVKQSKHCKLLRAKL